MKIKLPYALKGEELVHISKVDKGLSCGCTCPCCGHPLVAKKGLKKIHHFAHHQGSECAGAVETALHLAAKKILSEEKKIVIPPVELKFGSNRGPIVLAKEQVIDFDQVVEEKKTSDIIPDIIGIKGDRRLLIEIKVTHGVDEEKLKKIRHLRLSTIEIDLSEINRELTEELLRDLIVESIKHKKWLYNAHVDQTYKRFLNTGVRRDVIWRVMFARHIDYCPTRQRTWRGKPYANVVDDCLYCPYAYKIREDYVVCGGENRVDTYDDLKAFYKGNRGKSRYNQ